MSLIPYSSLRLYPLSAFQRAKRQHQKKADKRKIIDQIAGVDHASIDIVEVKINAQIFHNWGDGGGNKRQHFANHKKGEDD